VKSSDYKAILTTVLKDLADAIYQREVLSGKMLEVNAQIETLRETAYSVSQLCDADPAKEFPNLFGDESPDPGFTDAVRGLFQPGNGYTPVEVRSALRRKGFKIDEYKNPLASIHTILKRLVKSGELSAWQDNEDSPVTYFKISDDDEVEQPRPEISSAIVFGPPQRLTRKQVRQQEKQKEEAANGPSRFPPPTRRRPNPFQEMAEDLKREKK
jgi:hypothetical protein